MNALWCLYHSGKWLWLMTGRFPEISRSQDRNISCPKITPVEDLNFAGSGTGPTGPATEKRKNKKHRNSSSTIHMKMSIYDCWTSKIGLSDSKGCYTELSMILSSFWVWKRFHVSRKIHQLTNPRWHCGIQSAGHCALWWCRDQVSWSFMSTSEITNTKYNDM